mmetsp:Transcript_28354/g.92820  ORF Transcript_28354/g.92820 Transcript_28354/m.92820 type:complete len:299 (-) Transcript_28354:461-1357(-)
MPTESATLKYASSASEEIVAATSRALSASAAESSAARAMCSVSAMHHCSISRSSLASSQSSASWPAPPMTENDRASWRNLTVMPALSRSTPAGLPGLSSVAAVPRLPWLCTSASSYHVSVPVESANHLRPVCLPKRQPPDRGALMRRASRNPLLRRGTDATSRFNDATSLGSCAARTPTSSRAAAAQPAKSMGPASTSRRARSRASSAATWSSKKPSCDDPNKCDTRSDECRSAARRADSDTPSSPSAKGSTATSSSVPSSTTPASRAATRVMLIDAAANGNGPRSDASQASGRCSSA